MLNLIIGLVSKVFGEWLHQWWYRKDIKDVERLKIRQRIEEIRVKKHKELEEMSNEDLARRADETTGGPAANSVDPGATTGGRVD